MPPRHVRFASPLVSHPFDRQLPHPIPGPTPYRMSAARTPRAQAHLLLAPTRRPLIRYDISLPPSSITSFYNGLPRSLFGGPATNPPQPRLTLTNACIPWTFMISASNGHYVNVNDVFVGLYAALRTNVTLPEYNSLQRARHRHKICKSYRKRYRCLWGQDYVREKSEGIKRIDFMMGHTVFFGLRQIQGHPDIWHVDTVW
ncbi:hypothetical protein R3P38DRAFT_2581155 [Favolaschia claudopus]|uniref:DUF6699 domain-containing protein n=1 Tax=Favolaschia claudopus TaxID=2862362 RepID=A0AAV9ZCT5_9AGAR